MKLDIFATNSRTLRTAAIISSLLLAPFIILESATTGGFPRGFPAALFGFLWMLGMAFVGILHSVTVSRRAVPNAVLVLKVGALIFIAWMWVSIVIDQMPCFLGVPNCD